MNQIPPHCIFKCYLLYPTHVATLLRIPVQYPTNIAARCSMVAHISEQPDGFKTFDVNPYNLNVTLADFDLSNSPKEAMSFTAIAERGDIPQTDYN